MIVKVIRELGYDESTFATGLSMGITEGISFEEYCNNASIRDRMQKVCKKLCGKGNGHDNFLTGMVVWLDCTFTRDMWQEADRYHWFQKVGSASTMHTLMKRELVKSDFTEDTDQDAIDIVNKYISTGEFSKAKANLPEGFLQRRVACTNYQQLRTMIKQRKDHKKIDWRVWSQEVVKQVNHPDMMEVV